MKMDDVAIGQLMELVKDDPALQAKIGQLQQAAIVSRDAAARAEQAIAEQGSYEASLKQLDERVQKGLTDLAQREAKLKADHEAAKDDIARAKDWAARIIQLHQHQPIACSAP